MLADPAGCAAALACCCSASPLPYYPLILLGLHLAFFLQDCPQVDKYADQLVEARKAKQLTREGAIDMLQDLNMFGRCWALQRSVGAGLDSGQWVLGRTQVGGCWLGGPPLWATPARPGAASCCRRLTPGASPGHRCTGHRGLHPVSVPPTSPSMHHHPPSTSIRTTIHPRRHPPPTTPAGTMMVRSGDADGMVSGAMCTTANTIRPALQACWPPRSPPPLRWPQPGRQAGCSLASTVMQLSTVVPFGSHVHSPCYAVSGAAAKRPARPAAARPARPALPRLSFEQNVRKQAPFCDEHNPSLAGAEDPPEDPGLLHLLHVPARQGGRAWLCGVYWILYTVLLDTAYALGTGYCMCVCGCVVRLGMYGVVGPSWSAPAGLFGEIRREN